VQYQIGAGGDTLPRLMRRQRAHWNEMQAYFGRWEVETRDNRFPFLVRFRVISDPYACECQMENEGKARVRLHY
jgi:hypothetical protein